MNSEQLEFKLDRRIALFENTLNLQMLSLTSHVFDCQIKDNSVSNNIMFAFDMVQSLRILAINRRIISSQPIPKFKVGGLIEYGKVTSEGDVFVKGCFDKSKNVSLLKYLNH